MEKIVPDANALRQTALQKKQIEVAIREELITIAEAINMAHENGEGIIEFKLATQYNIDGMSGVKMQQAVWCQLIEILEERNYTVGIILDKKEPPIMYVAWESSEEKEESEHQLRILADHTLQ